MKVWAMRVGALGGSPGFLPAWVLSASVLSASVLSASVLSASVLGAALVVAAPSAAWAQLNSPLPGNSGGISSRFKGDDKAKPQEAAPDAVPGDKARTPAAPSTHVAGDMPPTDALFDAINRGDIAAARDALNRGADLNGVNILGMTPMELSVDLGRNDISFLLLSMRGEDGDRGARAVGREPAVGAAPAKAAAPARIASEARSAGRAKVADAGVAARPIATPKLFANDGGTPMPSVGFLGFDSRSAAN